MPTTSCGFENNPGLLARIGPTLIAQVGYDPNFRPSAGTRPEISAWPYDALVDTGSAVTCIDIRLANDLNLPIVGQSSDVAGVFGPGQAIDYSATIHLPELNATYSGSVIGAYLEVGGQPHSVIIGRDFLRHFRLTYDGRTGAATISND